jgi:probable F420-dependent oxidoreductase
MQIGAIFPHIQMGSDPAVIRDYAQAAEALGYSHIQTYEHVLGADPERPGGWSGIFDLNSSFLEPMVLFTFMAAVTTRIGFLPAIIILPQRQTVLVAKQAATLDRLSGGRLRSGVGIGWNELEYEALDQNFKDRGRRVDEQVDVLRKLWTQRSLDYEGRWHRINRAGIWPLPVQQPIPVWVGGHSDYGLKRAARIGDGWVSSGGTVPVLVDLVERLRVHVKAAGRSVEDFGVELRIPYGDGNPDTWQEGVNTFRDLKIDYMCFDPAGGGQLKSPAEYIDGLRRFKESVS